MALRTVKSLRAVAMIAALTGLPGTLSRKRKAPEGGITTGGMEPGDVEHRSDDRAAPTERSSPCTFAAVSGDGCESDEGRCSATAILAGARHGRWPVVASGGQVGHEYRGEALGDEPVRERLRGFCERVAIYPAGPTAPGWTGERASGCTVGELLIIALDAMTTEEGCRALTRPARRTETRRERSPALLDGGERRRSHRR